MPLLANEYLFLAKHLQKPEFKRISLWRIASRFGTSFADCSQQTDIGTPPTTPYNPTKLHDMPITHQRPNAAAADATTAGIYYGSGTGRAKRQKHPEESAKGGHRADHRSSIFT